MNDYDLKHVDSLEYNRISQYSSQDFKKGLELARKISKLKTDTINKNAHNISVQYSLKKIWKCVSIILDYCPSAVWHISVSPNGQTFDCYFVNDDISQWLGMNLFSYPASSSFSKDSETIVIAGGKGAIMIFKYLPVDEILVSDPKNQESRIKLANKLIILANKQCESGNHQEAIESYTTALKIDPNNSEAYNRRSTARSAIGDYQGAMEDLQRVRII